MGAAIKILINAVAAKSGGVATYVKNLAATLSKCSGEHRYIFLVPLAHVSAIQAVPGRVHVIGTDVALGSALGRLHWDQVKLRQLVHAEGIDLLFSTSDFGLWKAPCRQLLAIRTPIYFDDRYLKHILPRKSRRFKMEVLLRRQMVSLSAQQANMVMFATTSFMKDVQRWIALPDGKAIVNPFGVPLEKFSRSATSIQSNSQVERESLRLLYVSEYSDFKNLGTLLRALLSLRQQDVSFHLTTTLTPDQNFSSLQESASRNEDRRLLAEQTLKPCITVTGSVPYEQVHQLYRQADLFVFPSLVESFGHPLIEAMASGLPVLASDIPVCREVCGDAALYFNPLDPNDLAEKIVMLKQNKALRATLAEHGPRRVQEQYTWEGHVSRLVRLFQQLASSSMS